jgi:hypothetical protein
MPRMPDFELLWAMQPAAFVELAAALAGAEG